MSEQQNLSIYVCTEPPKTLWRVEHCGSRSNYIISRGDFVASGETSVSQIRNAEELKQAIERHLDWYCELRSCFLSTLSDETHAHNWGNIQNQRNKQSNARVYTIDTAKLPRDTVILDVCSVMQMLGIVHPSTSDHEFLFLGKIPGQAIVWSEEVYSERFRAAKEKATEVAAREFRDRFKPPKDSFWEKLMNAKEGDSIF